MDCDLCGEGDFDVISLDYHQRVNCEGQNMTNEEIKETKGTFWLCPNGCDRNGGRFKWNKTSTGAKCLECGEESKGYREEVADEE